MRTRLIRPRTRWRAVAFGGLLLAASSFLAAFSVSAGDSPPGTPVGADCADCHEEIVETFATGGHARAWHFGAGAAGTCESCHTGVEAHLDSTEPDDILTPSEMSAEDAAAVCLSCHKGEAAQAHWMGSAHQRRGVTCIDCHTVHEAPPPDSMVDSALRTESCYDCHRDVRSEMLKISHHPVREGKMSCTDCHDPHGNLTKGNLRAASVNDLCYDCHTEKRGPFLWEHAAVRDSCLNCHAPHGSNHLKLQTTSVPYLCQQCHINTRHPGTLYDATRLPTLDDDSGSNRVFNRACVDCHAAIHGSNHPSSPYLGH